MDLPESVSEYLEHITEGIKNTMPVSAIYLFGSYAKGNYRENSDIDIYVVTPDKSRRLLDLGLEADMSFEHRLRIPVEILVGYEDDFERRSKLINTVENEIIETGLNIYANK